MMGFQDENGTLTALVRAKGGDIYAVLDAIKAVQQNTSP